MRKWNRNKFFVLVVLLFFALTVSTVCAPVMTVLAQSDDGQSLAADGPPMDDISEEDEPDFTEPAAVSLTIKDAPKSIKVGETATLSYVLNNADETVFWSSSDRSILTVDGKGRLKGIAPGRAQITASIDDIKKSVMITVEEADATTIRIVVSQFDEFEAAEKVHHIHVGNVMNVQAVVEPEGAQAGEILWEISDKEIVDFDIGGQLVAKAKGEATITVKAGDLSDEIVFLVEPNGLDLNNLFRYGLIGLGVLLLIIIIVLIAVNRSKKARARERAEERARQAARKKKEAERVAKQKAEVARKKAEEARLREESYMRGYIDKERDMTDRMTRIYDASVMEKIQPPPPPEPPKPPQDEGPDRPFSLDDIE